MRGGALLGLYRVAYPNMRLLDSSFVGVQCGRAILQATLLSITATASGGGVDIIFAAAMLMDYVTRSLPGNGRVAASRSVISAFNAITRRARF